MTGVNMKRATNKRQPDCCIFPKMFLESPFSLSCRRHDVLVVFFSLLITQKRTMKATTGRVMSGSIANEP
jgi:hypothetical protein